LENQSIPKIKELIKEEIGKFEGNKLNKGAYTVINVDPY